MVSVRRGVLFALVLMIGCVIFLSLMGPPYHYFNRCFGEGASIVEFMFEMDFVTRYLSRPEGYNTVCAPFS